MITKGYIVSKSKENSNKYLVRIPIFEAAGIGSTSNGINASVSECTLCYNPGTYEGLKTGDCVFVSFEDNKLAKPVILGKLFVSVEEESSAFQYNTDLKVTHKATLPADTTIGSIKFENISKYFEAINEALDKKDIFVNSIQFKTDNPGAGRLFFNDEEGVFQASLSPNVTMAIGVDAVLKVYNDTEDALTDGTVVYNSGSTGTITKVKPSIADNHIIANNTIGVVTETIPSHGYGFISRRGYVGGLLINPGVFTLNDPIYLSTTVPGAFMREKPTAPYFVTYIGYISKLSSSSSTYDGQIYVDIKIIPISSDISYDNSDSDLESQTVKDALDELSADISMLTPEAIDIITDTAQFNTILSSADTNVQHALETLDKHNHALPVASDTVLGAIKIGDGLNVELDGTVSVDILEVRGVKISLSDSESPPPIETLREGDFWYEY